MQPIVGILALQGDFGLHQHVVTALGQPSLLVRNAEELEKCAGLIIPGGESTTMTHLLVKHGMWEHLYRFVRQKPVFGTCAGLVLLAARIENDPFAVKKLGVIDITVRRNAYGRQIDSFTDTLKLNLDGQEETAEGVFIRAPRIVEFGGTVLPKAWHGQHVVMVEERNVLGATFHPELTENTRIHRYFIEKLSPLD